MNFISYVIAWVIITVLFAVIMTCFEKLIVLVRDKTSLGNYHRRKKEEENKQLAHFLVEELISKGCIK